MEGYPKTYSFVEPLIGCDFVTLEVVLTEDEILDCFWHYYQKVMENLGREATKQQCIDDFLVVNWAEEVTEFRICPYGVVRMDYEMWKKYKKWATEQELI